jgi:hypothetical protein
MELEDDLTLKVFTAHGTKSETVGATAFLPLVKKVLADTEVLSHGANGQAVFDHLQGLELELIIVLATNSGCFL